MSVAIHGDEESGGAVVFRLEASPDATWRAIFKDGLVGTVTLVVAHA